MQPATPVVFVDHCARQSGAELALEGLLAALDRRSDVTLAGLIVGADGPMVERWRRLLPVDVLSADDPTRRRVSRRGMKLSALPDLFMESRRVRRAAKHHRSASPDTVLYFNTLRSFVVARPLLPRGVPVVVHVRDRIQGYFGELPRRFLLACLRRADAVIANSPGTAQEYADAGVPDGKISTIASPLRSEFQHSAPSSAGRDRRRLASVATLTPWKGQDLAIQAVQQLRADGTSVELHIVGSPLFGDVDYEQRLRDLAGPDLDDAVRFHGHVDDVSALLDDVGIGTLVHTSRLPEPLGMSVVEALALGLAVVAADAGGPSELIDDGVTGVLVAPNDVVALVEGIGRAIGDVGATIAANARDALGARFDPDAIAELTMRTIGSLR